MSTCLIRVAILDDDPSIRTALVRLLKSAGMDAHAFATGNNLFEFVALERPDCLLLDLEMPEMDGLDVLNYFKQRRIRIPTIIISGSVVASSRSACLNAGALTCLAKPPDPDLLIQTIESVTGSSQSYGLTSYP